MHQRDQETIAPGKVPDSIQVVRHKPFYAAEVVLKDVDLRAVLAVFSDPLKQSVLLSANPNNTNQNKASSNSEIPPSWLNSDDFVETDWSPAHGLPEIRLFPVLTCPKVTYLKKNSHVAGIQVENSKFGDEDTHTCLLGSEPCENFYVLQYECNSDFSFSFFPSRPTSRDFSCGAADCSVAAYDRRRKNIGRTRAGALESWEVLGLSLIHVSEAISLG